MRWLVAFVNIALVVGDGALLDLEELKTSFYSVQISEIPIPQPLPERSQSFDFGEDEVTMEVASKYGQRYVCHYQQTPSKPAEELEDKATELNITELLEPMRDGVCLIKTKDWWSYEFCYGRNITQFHLHNGEPTGDVILLGKYESDQTWLPEDLEKLKKSTVNRYHTQKYVNGSNCDLTGKARKVEVRFSCVEGEIDHIGAVAELEPCSYIIFVYTSKICHHPYLKPPTQARPSAIKCQPIVSQSIYEQYLSKEEAHQQTKEESKRDATKSSLDWNSLFDKALGDVSFTSLDEYEKSAAEGDQGTGSNTRRLGEQEAKLLRMLADVMAKESSKNTVSKYKDNIRQFVSSQFDDIIDEAKTELGDEVGEVGKASPDIEELKSAMAGVLEQKLNELEEMEKRSNSVNDEQHSASPDATEAKQTEGEAGSGESSSDTNTGTEAKEKPASNKPSMDDIKIEIIETPQQLEVEMIDLEDIREGSEFYDAAKAAQNQQAGSEDKTVKTVIAVLRPMQQKGTRPEEKKHQQLEQNYGKRWAPHNEDQRDEL